MGPLLPPPWTAMDPLQAPPWIATVPLEPDITDLVSGLTQEYQVDSTEQVKLK